MFTTDDDLGKASGALAKLDEASIFLMTLTVEGWKGQAAVAADQARIEHIAAVSEATEQVRALSFLLRRREELRALLVGGMR